MKKIMIFALSVCLLASLAACGKTNGDSQKKTDETQTITGVINQLDDYLILLDDSGEYRFFDFGPDVDQSALEEGDTVTVTYTGTLSSEDPAPVATAIEKTDG